MAYLPLTSREWLEDMRRFQSRDADRAKELLDQLDAAEGAEDELRERAETIGDFDEAAETIKDHANAVEWLKASELARDFYSDDLAEAVKEVIAYAQKLEEMNWAIRDLAKRAGLIAETDEATDIAPLLAMFLPGD